MLIELDVQGLGVIESSEVDLSPGSTALTGETGAGKTLLVLALGLLRGGRAERSMVRQGAARALVEARFRVSRHEPVVRLLRDAGIELEENGPEVEIILSRSVAPDGRPGRARINGSMVGVADLASVGGSLIEIAGQNEHGRIASPSVQRSLLDVFAGVSEDARQLAVTVRRARSAEAEAHRRREGERARIREVDILGYEISEIEAADVQVGEIARLTSEARRLENAEAIAAALTRATEELRGEGGVEDRLGAVESLLRTAAEHDASIRQLVARVESLRLELVDVASDAAAALVPPDGDDLSYVQDRLAALTQLRRRFGDTEEEILAHLDKSRQRREELLHGEQGLTELERAAGAAWAEASGLAARLTSARRGAAERLSAAMEERLAGLALRDARFEVRLIETDLGEQGAEAVDLLVSVNPGEAPKAIGKIASGGELSRISLALHLLTRRAGASTLVFDEVDAGVGGEAAQSIGRALSELARDGGPQVLVVTHLPQVAAFADHHLKVTKSDAGGRTRAEVQSITGDERVLELSRMLAGLPGSELGQKHARELLQVASSKAAP